MTHEELRLYDHFFKQLEEFEKWAKGEQRIGPIYPLDYCPGCKDIKFVHYYSPDAWDDWCSPSNKRYRMRFEPCGHDFDCRERTLLLCNFSKKLREKYEAMQKLKFQFGFFKENLKDIERAKIASFKADMNVLQVIKKQSKKIKI